MIEDQLGKSQNKQEQLPIQEIAAEVPKTPEQIASEVLEMAKETVDSAEKRGDVGLETVKKYAGAEQFDISEAQEVVGAASSKIEEAKKSFDEKTQTIKDEWDPSGDEPPPLTPEFIDASMRPAQENKKTPPPLPKQEWDPSGGMPPPLTEEYIAKNTEEGEKAKFCTNCGKPIRSGANFCTECGTKVAILKPKQQEEWDPNGDEPPPLDDEDRLSFKEDQAHLLSEEEETILARKQWERKEKERSQKAAEEREQRNKNSKFEKLDPSLFRVSMGEENYHKFIEKQRNLPSDAIVKLYHGLNGGYKSVIEAIDSPTHGVRQGSGPTVSLVPVGQFWKGMGFCYSLRRDQIEFPGESNPNAVIRMSSEDNMLDSGEIINQEGGLPLDQYEAEILRSSFVETDPEIEKEILDKMNNFAESRKRNLQNNE